MAHGRPKKKKDVICIFELHQIIYIYINHLIVTMKCYTTPPNKAICGSRLFSKLSKASRTDPHRSTLVEVKHQKKQLTQCYNNAKTLTFWSLGQNNRTTNNTKHTTI